MHVEVHARLDVRGRFPSRTCEIALVDQLMLDCGIQLARRGLLTVTVGRFAEPCSCFWGVPRGASG